MKPDPYPADPPDDNRPLVTLEVGGHGAIPLRCCEQPKPSPTQVSEWGETLTVYCANCGQELVRVVGPPASVVNGGG